MIPLRSDRGQPLTGNCLADFPPTMSPASMTEVPSPPGASDRSAKDLIRREADSRRSFSMEAGRTMPRGSGPPIQTHRSVRGTHQLQLEEIVG